MAFLQIAFNFTPELVKQPLSRPKPDLVMEGKEKREQHTRGRGPIILHERYDFLHFLYY